eukprot:g16656.t1
MSEQLPPLISHDSLRIITAAAQVGEVSNDVLSFLSASAEYHLLDVINDASNFRARGKRSRLTVDDVNASLELRGAEGSLVFSGGTSKRKEDEVSGGADSKVDLRKVANAALPVCPIEPGFHMHWLAVDGQQPLLPQNPVPSAGRGKGKGKGGKRGRGKQAGGVAGGGSSAVRARLSEELTTYLRRCCDAVLSRDESKRGRALASLREDPGLQQLLPHLCTFIQSKVPEYLKRQKEPDQLAALLQMLQCLLNNKHFAFLEIYLDRLLPPLMSCLLHIDFERTTGGGGANSDSSSNSFSARAVPAAKWTHWKVRDYAAELLRAICDKHGHTYPTLQARANDMFYLHVARPKTMLTTLYGSITGIACLGPMPVEQTLGPRVDSLAERISQACLAASLKRDTKGVVEANQCRLALLRAIGLSTMASANGLFGERGRNNAPAPPTTQAAPTAEAGTAPTAEAGTAAASARAEGTVESTAPQKSNDANDAATKAPAAAAAAGGGGGSSSSSSSGSKSANGSTAAGGGSGDGSGNGRAAGGPGRVSPHPRRQAASLRRRLDRELYSPPSKADRVAKVTAAAATAAVAADEGKPAVAAAGSAGAGAAAAAVGVGDGSGREGEDGSGSGGDGDAGALDEVVFPWYVVGLRRDGANQGWWLTDAHRVFV